MARKLAAFFLLFQVIGIFAESFNKSLPIDDTASETSVTMNDHTVVNDALYSLWVIMIFFNLVGCLYILVRVFLKWRASESGILPMTDRLPGYTAITDLFLTLLHIYELVYFSVTGYIPDSTLCVSLALFKDVVYIWNKYLYVIISVLSYLKVVRLVNWELGRYDRRLFFIINILTIFTIIPRLNDGYGRLKY
ncbi:hypothetical protein G9A89_000182, partial [Geosiphon pyriformis]